MFGKLFKFHGKARHSNRRTAQARAAFSGRRRPCLEELETRCAPAVTLSIIGGVLTAQCDSALNTVTVDHSGSSAIIDGQSFLDTTYNSIAINGGAGGMISNIRANVKPLTVFGDTGNDVVNLGDTASKVQGIQATVLLENEPTFSTVNINDQGDTTTHTVTLATVTRSGDSSLGQVTGLGAAAIQWDYLDTSAVNLNLGSGTSTVIVMGTGVTTNLFNNGAATINVGAGGSVMDIQGALNLENEPSYDTVNINDQSDSTTETVTVSTITRSGDSALGAVNGLGAAQITWDVLDTTAVNLNLGSGASTVNVLGTGTTTNIFNSAAATINVGNSGSVAGIQGALNLENEPSFDTVNINDQNDTTTETVTLSTITRSADTSLGAVNGLGASQITWDYNDTSAVNLNLGSGASTVNVLGTGVTTNIFNSAAATINVGNSGSVAGIQGQLNLENEPSFDTVNINDQNDATINTATISTVTRSGDTSLGALDGVAPAEITWDYFDTTAVNLNFGSGTSTVNVLATGDGGSATTTNIFNSGPATINVGNAGSLAGIQGQLNLENEPSFDTVNINGQADSASNTVTLSTVTRSGDTSLGALDGLAPAEITWDYFDTASVTINAGSGGNTFNIEAADVATTINGGTGINCFHVSPAAQTLANITGGLTLIGSGADILDFFDQNNPSSETYTFDAVPSSLTLATAPAFSCSFTGMTGAYLETNGLSTVNDASGTVFVDVPPPC
jgi:hypothetical protein